MPAIQRALVVLLVLATSAALRTAPSLHRRAARAAITVHKERVEQAAQQPLPSSDKMAAAPLSTLAVRMAAMAPLDALAADGALPSAFAAYGHYLGLVLVSVSLAAERLLIKPGMGVEEEKLLGYADILYGLAGTLVLVSGYYRVTEYGKGWEYYSHEPIFWVKMFLFSVMGASSLFPTIKIVQRAIAIKNAEDGKEGCVMPAPMSDKMARRMGTIVNGELLAIASIPLAASLMSRGVLYSDAFPWQAGAAVVALAVGGLGFKYTKEALSWQEEELSA